MLKLVLSGGQSGSDVAALITAKKFGIPTGGVMPKGFKTLNGPRPQYAEMYNIKEHSSPLYPPRTGENVQSSDGTLRLAFDYNSAGEICTKKFIEKHQKPSFDVDLNNPCSPQLVVDWIKNNQIHVLNVAGNSEKTYGGITIIVIDYLTEVFKLLGFKETNA